MVLSGLKNTVRKRDPEFSEKQFGYSGFLQFCQAARARGSSVSSGTTTPTTTVLTLPGREHRPASLGRGVASRRRRVGSTDPAGSCTSAQSRRKLEIIAGVTRTWSIQTGRRR